MNTPTNIYINKNVLNNTNQKVYYSSNKANNQNEIDLLFKDSNIVYDKKVTIITKDETITKTIIAKENNSLITNMHEIIPIEKIINIKLAE